MIVLISNGEHFITVLKAVTIATRDYGRVGKQCVR